MLCFVTEYKIPFRKLPVGVKVKHYEGHGKQKPLLVIFHVPFVPSAHDRLLDLVGKCCLQNFVKLLSPFESK